MSYIRSTSNPEGLYIWCTLRGTVYISHLVKYPLSSSKTIPSNFTVSKYIFEHILKKWDGQDKLQYRGLKVEEICVNLKTGKISDGFGKNKGPFQFMIRLSYKEHFVTMWNVTWEYIVSQFNSRNTSVNS